MKTAEKVLERVKFTEQRIQWAEEEIRAEMTKVQQWLEKNAVEGPEYISQWLPTYMQPVDQTKAELEGLRKELYLLQWVLYDDAVANTAQVLRDGEVK